MAILVALLVLNRVDVAVFLVAGLFTNILIICAEYKRVSWLYIPNLVFLVRTFRFFKSFGLLALNLKIF